MADLLFYRLCSFNSSAVPGLVLSSKEGIV